MGGNTLIKIARYWELMAKGMDISDEECIELNKLATTFIARYFKIVLDKGS